MVSILSNYYRVLVLKFIELYLLSGVMNFERETFININGEY